MVSTTHTKQSALLFLGAFFAALIWSAARPSIDEASRAPSGGREVAGLVQVHDAAPSMPRTLSAFIASEWRIPVEQSKALVRKAFAASQAYDLDPLLILAVMAQESSFRNFGNAHAWLRDPDAPVNPLAAHGPMQVAGRWHQEKMPRDADGAIRQTTLEENVRLGAWIIREYIEADRGDLRAALQRYNGNRADREARYAKAVFAHLKSLEAALSGASDVAMTEIGARTR